MLELIDTGVRTLDRYRGIAADEQLERLRTAARRLRGVRILHVNATRYGGGVSELLRSTVPLANGLGIRTDWRVISAEPAFFEVTKVLHNGLQGMPVAFSDAQRRTFLQTTEQLAREFEEEYDLVFLHDPQTAGLLGARGSGSSRWIWRNHIDTSAPDPAVWSLLRPMLAAFDAAVFTLRDFVPPDLPVQRVAIIQPAIDPVSPKNLDLPLSVARELLDWYGIAADRPLVTQVSRFDPWKDPLGVLAAYRTAREQVPGLQLALLGSMALDDPEGARVYREVLRETAEDPLVHVLTNLTGISNVEVNAFQRLSSVVVQKSIREGFGLVVAEALWKGTPVVAGRTGGIPLQIGDDGGFLVESVPECAEALARVLRDRDLGRAAARRGRERIRRHYLTPRLLADELELARDVLERRPFPPPRDEDVDPVCGMKGREALTATVDGRSYRFCSRECRQRFEWRPERYAVEP